MRTTASTSSALPHSTLLFGLVCSALAIAPDARATEASVPLWRQSEVSLTLSGPPVIGLMPFVNATEAAVESWADTSEAPALTIAVDPSGPSEVALDGVNAVFFIQHDWPGLPTQLALTFKHVTDEGILEADLALNAQHHRFSVHADGEPPAFDLQNLLTHELGHVLGLPHLDQTEASMFESIDPGETKKRDLDAADQDALITLYEAAGLQGGCSAGGGHGPLFGLLGLLAFLPYGARRTRGPR